MLNDISYTEILTTVLGNLRPVIEPNIDEANLGAQQYERVLGVPFDQKGLNIEKVKEFVISVCRGKQLRVTMIPCRRNTGAVLPPLGNGFVSWLVYSGANRDNPADKDIHILYHVDMANDFFNPKKNEVDYSKTNRCLSLVLLHECCHALRHLYFIEVPPDKQFVGTEGSRSLPGVNPEHEQEAWAYALFTWAILVGDFSCATRRQTPESERGWQIA